MTIYEMAMLEAEKVSEEKDPVISNGKLKSEWFRSFSSRGTNIISTRKVERAIIFITLLTLTIIYISIKMLDLSTLEFIEILGVWLAYGGFQSHQITRERIAQKNIEEIT